MKILKVKMFGTTFWQLWKDSTLIGCFTSKEELFDYIDG